MQDCDSNRSAASRFEHNLLPAHIGKPGHTGLKFVTSKLKSSGQQLPPLFMCLKLKMRRDSSLDHWVEFLVQNEFVRQICLRLAASFGVRPACLKCGEFGDEHLGFAVRPAFV